MKKGLEVAKREKVAPIKKMVGPLAPIHYQDMNNRAYGLRHLLIVALVCLLAGAIGASHGPFLIKRLSVLIPPGSKPLIRHPLNF